MHIKHIVIICMFWATPIAAIAPDPEKTDSLIVSASDTTMAYKKRVRILKQAIRYDRSGKAMHTLAKLYLTQEGSHHFYDAEYWLKQAIARERKNATYHATHAEALWQLDLLDGSHHAAKRALDRDPNNVKALYYAGRFQMWNMQRNIHTVSMAYSPFGVVPFSLKEYGEEGRDKAIDYLTRALKINPDHRPSRMLLGLIYYESDRPNDLISLFANYAKRHPSDSDAFFFIGLGYQAKDRLSLAYRAYMKGLELMPEEQQLFFKSIVMLADINEQKKSKNKMPNDEAVRAFWVNRNPLFLSPLNERLMAHCGRVAYANLRFSDPHLGIEGWKTDKGEAYIRYGRPKTRRARTAEYRRARTEVWEYDDFQMVFFNAISETWKFHAAHIGRVEVDLFKDFIDRIPEYYQDPYRQKRYPVPYQVAQFRGEQNKVRVEMYYALPEMYVDHQNLSPGVKSVDMRQGLFLFDTAWDTVSKNVAKVTRMPRVEYTGTREHYLFATEGITLDPGKYYLVAEAEDQKTKTVGTLRDSIITRNFNTDSLQVSSLLLARKIKEREDSASHRDHFMILPNPLKQYRQDTQAAFYFEVYNLQQDDFGTTQYKVTYQVRTLPEGESDGDPDWVTAVSYNFRGAQDWEPLYLMLGLESTRPGPQDFRVVVHDLQSQQEAITSAHFRVMW